VAAAAAAPTGHVERGPSPLSAPPGQLVAGNWCRESAGRPPPRTPPSQRTPRAAPVAWWAAAALEAALGVGKRPGSKPVEGPPRFPRARQRLRPFERKLVDLLTDARPRRCRPRERAGSPLRQKSRDAAETRPLCAWGFQPKGSRVPRSPLSPEDASSPLLWTAHPGTETYLDFFAAAARPHLAAPEPKTSRHSSPLLVFCHFLQEPVGAILSIIVGQSGRRGRSGGLSLGDEGAGAFAASLVRLRTAALPGRMLSRVLRGWVASGRRATAAWGHRGGGSQPRGGCGRAPTQDARRDAGRGAGRGAGPKGRLPGTSAGVWAWDCPLPRAAKAADW